MVHTLQITIGSGVTQVSTTSVPVKQVIFQNNGGTNTARVGGIGASSTVGAKLAISGGTPLALGNGDAYCADLREFYIAGTQNDVIDVTYIA